MPAVAETTEVQAAEFDGKAFMESRNKGEAPKPVPAKPAAAEPAKPEEAHEPRLSRSQSRLQREIGRQQAQREILEKELTELRAKVNGGTQAAPVEDAEPQRSQFASDAEYLRATQKWDKAQEAKSSTTDAAKTQEQEQYAANLKAMDDKAAADIALIPDWDEVAKKAMEDDDAPEFDPAEQTTFMALLSQSDVRAFALHHFAKNPDALQKILDLKPEQQIKAFHRLEGRLEKEYDSRQAAQADPEKGKTASTPQKPQGRAEPQQEAQPAKPKPSSEVAARGGSPAPDEPQIGSPAWMAKRNQIQYGH